MTSHLFPDADTLIEMTVDAEPLRGVRVVQAEGAVLSLSLALDAVPPRGMVVTLRWPAGPRGRYAQTGTVVRIDENRVDIKLTGEPELEQQRNFVRGGGGEKVLLRRDGQTDAVGWIRDISEQGMRAHFADVVLQDGDEVMLRIQLEPDLVQVKAVASKVGTLRQSIPPGGQTSVEVVAIFIADEGQAQVIRRYVLRMQLLARTRMLAG
jgi:hypothetical protein